MKKTLNILYAHRNRDLERIRFSLDSLANQHLQNFQVIFVDYGSQQDLVNDLKELLKNYDFVRFFPLPVQQLLWNKSKALNYGALQGESAFLYIADVDLIFHPQATALMEKVKDPKKFNLFKLGYLNQRESEKLRSAYKFEDLEPSRWGSVNGMILSSRESFLEVNGLDEFFHFYGAEDEDLFARLENAGYSRSENSEKYFYHNWHRSFSGSEDYLLTGNPRIKNIMRINQKHFQNSIRDGIVRPSRQKGMARIIQEEEKKLLHQPTKCFQVSNILAHVEHFLREEMTSYNGHIIRVEFVEDPYFLTLKHKIKKVLGKQTQIYCSMKVVNDMVLKEILYNYRDHNYAYSISEDLKKITFHLEIK